MEDGLVAGRGSTPRAPCELRSGPDVGGEGMTSPWARGIHPLMIWACLIAARYVLIVVGAMPSCARAVTK